MVKTYTSNILSSKSTSHGFFTRLGGVSSGLYAGLNLGLGSNDARKNVLENRSLVAKHIGVSHEQLLTLYQVHSPEVVTVTSPWDINDLPKADAMVTNEKGLALGILTADCVPVLFADHKNGIIGAAHAGWKGALAGVVANTVEAMCELGAERTHINATVGPAIAQKSYEVGAEVRQQFIEKDADFAKFFSQNPKGNYQFGLSKLVFSLLEAEKIESLDQISQDTYQNQDEFYSFRRATHKKEGDYGRQISAICLNA